MTSEISIRNSRLFGELVAKSVAVSSIIEEREEISNELEVTTRQLDILLIEAKKDVSVSIWLRAGTSQHIHTNYNILESLGVDQDNELTLNGKKVYDGSKETPGGESGDSYFGIDENGDLVPKPKADGTARGIESLSFLKSKKLFIPNGENVSGEYSLFVGELGDGSDVPEAGGGGSDVTFNSDNEQYGVLSIDGEQVGILSLNGHTHSQYLTAITKKNVADALGSGTSEDEIHITGVLSMNTLILPNESGTEGDYELYVGSLGSGSDVPIIAKIGDLENVNPSANDVATEDIILIKKGGSPEYTPAKVSDISVNETQVENILINKKYVKQSDILTDDATLIKKDLMPIDMDVGIIIKDKGDKLTIGIDYDEDTFSIDDNNKLNLNNIDGGII